MKSRKLRRLNELISQSTAQKRAERAASEAPGFLVRLVGKTRAKSLCQEQQTVQRRRD